MLAHTWQSIHDSFHTSALRHSMIWSARAAHRIHVTQQWWQVCANARHLVIQMAHASRCTVHQIVRIRVLPAVHDAMLYLHWVHSVLQAYRIPHAPHVGAGAKRARRELGRQARHERRRSARLSGQARDCKGGGEGVAAGDGAPGMRGSHFKRWWRRQRATPAKRHRIVAVYHLICAQSYIRSCASDRTVHATGLQNVVIDNVKYRAKTVRPEDETARGPRADLPCAERLLPSRCACRTDAPFTACL